MHPRLGEILCTEHGLAPSGLALGLRRAAARQSRLGTALRELRLIDDDQLAAALARQHNVPAVRDKHFASIADETRRLVPAELAHRHGAVPIGVVNGGTELVVAMRDPGDVIAAQSIAHAAGYKVRAAVAPEGRIARALDDLYGPVEPPAAPPPRPVRVDPYFTPPPARPSRSTTVPAPVVERPAFDAVIILHTLVVWVVLDALLGLYVDPSARMAVAIMVDAMLIHGLLRQRPWAAWLSLIRFAASWWLLSTYEHRLHDLGAFVLIAKIYLVVGLALSLLCVALMRD